MKGELRVRKNMRVWDKRNTSYQLPRSGWSVERAGLGATATYPA